MPGFGKESLFTGGSSGGERKPLPEGSYRILHSLERKDWGDGKGEKIQMKLVKADETDCCEWISGGMAEGVEITEDGKKLTDDSRDISSKTRVGGYCLRVQELGKLDEAFMGDLSNLDTLEITIARIPNPSQFAKPGATMIMPMAVSRPSGAKSKTKSPALGRSNGKAVPVALTEQQQQAVEALESYLQTPGSKPLTRSDDVRSAELEALKPFCPVEGEMQQFLVANTALTDKTVWEQASSR